MSRIGTITRRTLLVASAAVVGGVAFGYYKVRQVPPNPLRPAEGQSILNPWVIVRADGVTVITPRAEMGQGVQSTLAALVAEEMDLDWSQVRAEHGPPGAAYYNAALGELGTPFPAYRDSTMKDVMQGAMGAMIKVLGVQVTGGSTSTIDAFERMRRAGAAARTVLVQAAANRLGVPADTLYTETGAVIAPDGARLDYADLATEAAGLDVPQDPVLKNRSEWRLLGRPLPRLDMRDKVTGQAEFSGDIRLPGMKFATVRMSPRLGGAMTRFDATAARAMDGVDEVIDLGDGIAVVARNTWVAMQAAEAVEIDWGPAPYPDTTEKIFDRIAEAFDGDPQATMRDEGDAEAALNGASVIEAEYRVPYLAHSTMEPMSATALYNIGALTLWAGNQAPGMVRDAAAKALGIEADAVTVHTPFMGGGFGRRGEVDFAVHAARIAAALPGTPISMVWSREEDMRHDFYRPGAIARMSGVVGSDGPSVFRARIAAPSVIQQQSRRAFGFAPPGPDKLLCEGSFDQPYGIANFRVSGYRADVSVPIGSWRSVGNSHNSFFHECFLDELARAGGHDPVEMRLRLMRDEHAPSAKVVEAVAEMSGWGGDLPEGHARGVAFCMSFGSSVAEVIEIRQGADGIELVRGWAAIDVGTALDPRNIEAQVMSGMAYGLTAAIMGEITFADGQVEQSNFHDYDALRMYQAPPIETRILTANAHIGGVGEPGTPPAAPALANAVFALTGQRIRELPLRNHVEFA